jgi:hypothetical protein
MARTFLARRTAPADQGGSSIGCMCLASPTLCMPGGGGGGGGWGGWGSGGGGSGGSGGGGTPQPPGGGGGGTTVIGLPGSQAKFKWFQIWSDVIVKGITDGDAWQKCQERPEITDVLNNRSCGPPPVAPSCFDACFKRCEADHGCFHDKRPGRFGVIEVVSCMDDGVNCNSDCTGWCWM